MTLSAGSPHAESGSSGPPLSSSKEGGESADGGGTTSQVVTALRQITRAMDLHSRALLHQCGLTSPQLSTLRAIAGDQPMTAGRLAKQLHLGQPTVTGILDRLERRGLIGRVRGERDRRSVMLTLTPAGRDVLNAAPALMYGFSRQLAELRPWECAQILSNLQRVAEMLERSAREHLRPSNEGEGDAFAALSHAALSDEDALDRGEHSLSEEVNDATADTA